MQTYSNATVAYKKSIGGTVLNPYRRAAFAWVEANEENFWVQTQSSGCKGLYQRAGPHEEAFRLRRKTLRNGQTSIGHGSERQE